MSWLDGEKEYIPKPRTVAQACEILVERLGSGDDPITVFGIETTPRNLRHSCHADRPVNCLRIGYYTVTLARTLHKVRGGTLGGMIKERHRPHDWLPQTVDKRLERARNITRAARNGTFDAAARRVKRLLYPPGRQR